MQKRLTPLVTVIPPRMQDHTPEEPLDLKALMHEDFSPKYFDDLVRRYARSAVSGVVPKFLSPEIPEEPLEPGRTTLRTARGTAVFGVFENLAPL